MVEPDNLTIVLLREIRAEIASTRDAIRESEEKLNGRFDTMSKRLDAMHLNGVKALKGFIGHRAMVERTMASFDDQVAQLEMRVSALEGVRS